MIDKGRSTETSLAVNSQNISHNRRLKNKKDFRKYTYDN